MADDLPVFVDTSCLVAIEMREPGAMRLRTRIARAPIRYASTLAEAELMATLTREGRAAVAIPGIDWISPSRRLTRELERVLSAGYIRGADAWHLACALYLDPTASELIFLTLDTRQREVAQAVGFATK